LSAAAAGVTAVTAVQINAVENPVTHFSISFSHPG
jgi:hypothetical protein